MLYYLDPQKIGNRIREERIAAGFKTQSSFALAVNLREDSRQSVGKWENGICLPTFNTLLEMCKVFDCEIGYLLCEPGYSCKTRKATDVQKATGLSEKAIQKLFMFRKRIKGSDSYFNFESHINAIIEHDAFSELLEAIKKHIWSFNQNHYGLDKENPETLEAIANTFNCEPDELRGYIEMSSQSLIESIIMRIVNDIEVDKQKKPLQKQG